MAREVEIKFRITQPDELMTRLIAYGAFPAGTFEQRDQYFNHPARDFRQTDEALRIRSVDGVNELTYKGGARRDLTKIREEIECPLGQDSLGAMTEILLRLGFRSVGVVEKSRTEFRLEFENQLVTLAVDSVPFQGTFLELELIAESDQTDVCREVLLKLATRLGVDDVEPRSYLEMELSRELTSESQKRIL